MRLRSSAVRDGAMLETGDINDIQSFNFYWIRQFTTSHMRLWLS